MIITLVAGGGPLALGVVVAVALAVVLGDLVGTNVFFNGVVLKLDLLVIKEAGGVGGGFFNDPGVPIGLPPNMMFLNSNSNSFTSSKLGFRKSD